MSGGDDVGASSDSEIEGGLSLLTSSRVPNLPESPPSERTLFNNEITSKYSTDKLINDLFKYQSNQDTLAYIAHKAKQSQDIINKRSGLEEKIKSQVNSDVFKKNPAYLDYLVTHYEGKHGINLQDFFFIVNNQPLVLIPVDDTNIVRDDQILSYLACETREEFIESLGEKLETFHGIDFCQCKTFLKTIGCNPELIDQQSCIKLTLNPHIVTIPQRLIVKKVWYLVQTVVKSPLDMKILKLLLYTLLYFFMDKLTVDADGAEDSKSIRWLNQSMISLIQWCPPDTDTTLTTNDTFQERMSLLISTIDKITSDICFIARFLLHIDTGNAVSRYMCHALSFHYLSVPVEYHSLIISVEQFTLQPDTEANNKEIVRLLGNYLEKFCHCELDMRIPQGKYVYKQIQARMSILSTLIDYYSPQLSRSLSQKFHERISTLNQNYFHIYKSQVNPTIFETINSMKALEDKLFDKVLQSSN